MIIEIVSPIECRVSKQDGEKLRACLSFPAYYYVQKQYKKERREYQKHMFSQTTSEHYYFWFGLLTRVRRFCKSRNIKYQVTGDMECLKTEPPKRPRVPGYDFTGKWKFQLELIYSALKRKRGVVKAATGAGKTALQLGITSCYPDKRTIIFAHTLDIVSQTAKKAKKAGFDVGVFAEGKKETDKQLTIATIQSVGNPIMIYEDLLKVLGKSDSVGWWEQKKETQTDNLNLLVERSNFKTSNQLIKSNTTEATPARKIKKLIKECDDAVRLLERAETIQTNAGIVLTLLAENEIVMVDECHHLSKIEGSYAHALAHTFAPIRLGFTATLPTDTEAQMVLEGLIGNVIEELTIDEGVTLGILAKPKIRIIRSPYNYEVDREFSYQKAYDSGIVNNVRRNELIINTVIDYINVGKNVLVITNKIAHGENLISIAREICDVPKKEFDTYFKYIQGKTKSDERGLVKEALINKKISCVIATTIWCEGIDIPSLDVVVNAAGGKSETRVLQVIGRGLRKTSEKDNVIIVDIFDPHNRFLLSHFGERFTIYSQNDWV